MFTLLNLPLRVPHSLRGWQRVRVLNAGPEESIGALLWSSSYRLSEGRMELVHDGCKTEMKFEWVTLDNETSKPAPRHPQKMSLHFGRVGEWPPAAP